METGSNTPNRFLEYIACVCSYSDCAHAIAAFLNSETAFLNFSQPYFLKLGNGVNNKYVLHDKKNTAGRDFNNNNNRFWHV